MIIFDMNYRYQMLNINKYCSTNIVGADFGFGRNDTQNKICLYLAQIILST